jgi:hypothetical protein
MCPADQAYVAHRDRTAKCFAGRGTHRWLHLAVAESWRYEARILDVLADDLECKSSVTLLKDGRQTPRVRVIGSQHGASLSVSAYNHGRCDSCRSADASERPKQRALARLQALPTGQYQGRCAPQVWQRPRSPFSQPRRATHGGAKAASSTACHQLAGTARAGNAVTPVDRLDQPGSGTLPPMPAVVPEVVPDWIRGATGPSPGKARY